MGRSRLPFYVPVPSEAKMVPTAAAAQRHTKSRRRTRVRTAPGGPGRPADYARPAPAPAPRTPGAAAPPRPGLEAVAARAHTRAHTQGHARAQTAWAVTWCDHRKTYSLGNLFFSPLSVPLKLYFLKLEIAFFLKVLCIFDLRKKTSSFIFKIYLFIVI